MSDNKTEKPVNAEPLSESAVECMVIPPGAEPIGTPPRSWRIRFGQAITVGDIRKMLDAFDDKMPLMVRNGPLPTFFYHYLHGEGYVELD